MNQLKRPLQATVIAGLIAITSNPVVGQSFDDCGFLKCCGGILVFESDAGTIYQLIDPDIRYTPGTRARVVGDEDLTCEPSCPYATACIDNGVISPCFATNPMFTSMDDFKQGEFVDLHPVENDPEDPQDDDLEMNTWNQTKTANPPVLPYLWVSCSTRGTIVRIATADHYSPADGRCVYSGEILGEYWTAPEQCRSSGQRRLTEKRFLS